MPKLKGKWTEVALVTDYDAAGEAETLLGLTTGDITIGGDENVIEADSHADPITERAVIGGAPSIEIESFESVDEAVLEETGIFDGNGVWTVSDRTIEAVRVKVHSEDPANSAGPVRVYDGIDIEPEWSTELSFPEDDFAMSGVTFHCNGGVERNNAEETG